MVLEINKKVVMGRTKEVFAKVQDVTYLFDGLILYKSKGQQQKQAETLTYLRCLEVKKQPELSSTEVTDQCTEEPVGESTSSS